MIPVPRRNFLFLLNPRSGGGESAARLRRLLAREPALAGREESAQVRSVDDACRALQGLALDDVPVAVGGDGMVSLVASALRACGTPARAMGILPLGTGNILARALGIGGARRALRALREGQPRRVDVMRTSIPSASVAVVSISAGFEGRFLARYERTRRHARGLGVFAALGEAFGRADPIALELDGKVVLTADQRAYSAGLYNTRSYVGGVVMSPGADPTDGLGESVVYRSARAYWAALARGLRGGSAHAKGGVTRQRWRDARLESRGPLQIDGQPHPPGSVSVSMEAAALAVLVAPEDAAASRVSA